MDSRMFSNNDLYQMMIDKLSSSGKVPINKTIETLMEAYFCFEKFVMEAYPKGVRMSTDEFKLVSKCRTNLLYCIGSNYSWMNKNKKPIPALEDAHFQNRVRSDEVDMRNAEGETNNQLPQGQIPRQTFSLYKPN